MYTARKSRGLSAAKVGSDMESDTNLSIHQNCCKVKYNCKKLLKTMKYQQKGHKIHTKESPKTLWNMAKNGIILPRKSRHVVGRIYG